MFKKMRLLFLVSALMSSLLSLASGGSDENTGKSKREINRLRALRLCSTLDKENQSSWCKSHAIAGSYFQTEALDLCEQNAGPTIDFCIEQIKNRKYEGIYLDALKSCSNYEGFTLIRRGIILAGAKDGGVKNYTLDPSGCLASVNNLIPTLSEGKKFTLPENTQLSIPGQFIVPSGKSCTILKLSKNQDLDCEVCVNLDKDQIRNDNAFSISIIEIKNSEFTVSSDSITIDIINHDYIKTVKCGGLVTPNGEDRKSIENYFKAGGLDLKFPGPIQRN